MSIQRNAPKDINISDNDNIYYTNKAPISKLSCFVCCLLPYIHWSTKVIL